jgi:hypothetical protein
MTVRKKDNLLRGDRTPAYVDRETGAAELLISPDMGSMGERRPTAPTMRHISRRYPPPRWGDVDHKLSGAKATGTDAAMKGAANFGQKKGNRRDAA